MLTLLEAGAAQAFDVETATRVYLDAVQGAARARSDAYFEGGYWLILGGALVGVLVHWIMLHTGWSAAWSERSRRLTRRRWLQPAAYAVPFTIAGAVLALPWTIYAGFVRETQYDLMNLTFAGWLAEQAMAVGLAIVLGAMVFAIIFAVIRNSPRTWWLWGTGAAAALLALAIMIAPVFIAPLFNEYASLAPGPLRDQILEMAYAQGIPADNVYVFDQSRQTSRISANVSGMGPTIRISLNDNLLDRVSPAGIKAVMGHEMGHYVLNHVQRLVLANSLLALVALIILWWASPRILQRFGPRWGVHEVSDPAVAPLFAMIVVAFGLAATPVVNTVSRTLEVEADAFGLDAAREPDGFAEVAMLLSEYRKIEPGPWEERLFSDHPSGRARVRMAMEWKARHLDELPPGRRGIERPPPLEPRRSGGATVRAQTVGEPAGSGRYPEPRWLAMIQHDMMLFDHRMSRPDGTVSAKQRAEADVNIEFQPAARFAEAAMKLAFFFRDADEKYATDYPAAVGVHTVMVAPVTSTRRGAPQ